MLEKQHEEPPMKTQFNQSQGSTSRETNKEAIARIFGLKKSDVSYLTTNIPVDSYTILYDKTTQSCWYRGSSSGTPIAWASSDDILQVTTTSGTFFLEKATQLNEVLSVLSTVNGADSIGVSTGGTVEDMLQCITPEMVRVNGQRYVHGVTIDAVPFVQAAVDLANQKGLPTLLLRTYPMVSAPQEYICPGDDGTVYPAWITAGTDVNIAPEPTNKMNAHIRLYNNSRLVGVNMQTCGLRSNWSKTAGPYDLTGPIVLFISPGNKDSYVRYYLENLTISNGFIGRVCEGTSAFSYENNLQISGCGISGVFQGEDSVDRGFIKLWYNLAGDVFGGQWLTRNHAYASSYMPPYPATDIHRAGWCDSSFVEKYHYYGDTSFDWTHPANAAIDNFFATYFFKPANSAKTADGGRTSNSTQPGVWPMGEYKGITGRAMTRFSRYGREILNCNILEAKVMWSPRTPFYYTAQPGSWTGNSKIGSIILERVGIILYAGGTGPGNRFNVDNVDPWDTTQTTFPAMACRGNISAMDCTKSGSVQQSVINEINPAVTGGQIHRVMRNLAGDPVSLLTLQDNLGTSWTSRYVFNSNYASMQPTQYGSSGARFKYDYGKFTPVLTISGQVITSTEAIGIWWRFGDMIRVHVRIRNSSLTVTQTGGMIVSNLPFTAGSVQEGMSKGNVYTGAGNSGPLIPLVEAGTKQMRVLTNSAGTTFQHPAGDIDFTFHADFDYIIPFNSNL